MKRVEDPPLRRGRRGKFPGEIAGASLKLALMRQLVSRQPSNSPAKSPGPH